MDEDIETARAVADRLESLLYRFVARQVELQHLDSVFGIPAFIPDLLKHGFALLYRPTPEVYVVLVLGLKEGLDSFVADAVGGTGHDNYLGCHCAVLQGRES